MIYDSQFMKLIYILPHFMLYHVSHICNIFFFWDTCHKRHFGMLEWEKEATSSGGTSDTAGSMHVFNKCLVSPFTCQGLNILTVSLKGLYSEGEK